MMTDNKLEIDKILSNISNINKEAIEWNTTDIDAFIISFERNSVVSNDNIARKYGNIIKNISREIMTSDIPILEEWRVEHILEIIKNNTALYSKFNKLYILVKKKEKQKVN